jgi:hypothetical protein
MGLLLAEGKRLKHLKEKPHHKIPYHDLNFFVKDPASRRHGRTATLRLLLQPYDGAYYYYYHHHHPPPPPLLPSNGAPVEGN